MVKPNISQFIDACDHRYSDIENETYENVNERINKIKSFYNFISDNVKHISGLYLNEQDEINNMGSLTHLIEERDILLNRYSNLHDYFNTTGMWQLNQSRQRLLDIDHRIKNYNEKIIRIENHQGIITLFITFYQKAHVLYQELEHFRMLEYVTECKSALYNAQHKISSYFENQLTDSMSYPQFAIVMTLGEGKQRKKKRKLSLGKKRKYKNKSKMHR